MPSSDDARRRGGRDIKYTGPRGTKGDNPPSFPSSNHWKEWENPGGKPPEGWVKLPGQKGVYMPPQDPGKAPTMDRWKELDAKGEIDLRGDPYYQDGVWRQNYYDPAWSRFNDEGLGLGIRSTSTTWGHPSWIYDPEAHQAQVQASHARRDQERADALSGADPAMHKMLQDAFAGKTVTRANGQQMNPTSFLNAVRQSNPELYARAYEQIYQGQPGPSPSPGPTPPGSPPPSGDSPPGSNPPPGAPPPGGGGPPPRAPGDPAFMDFQQKKEAIMRAAASGQIDQATMRNQLQQAFKTSGLMNKAYTAVGDENEFAPNFVDVGGGKMATVHPTGIVSYAQESGIDPTQLGVRAKWAGMAEGGGMRKSLEHQVGGLNQNIANLQSALTTGRDMYGRALTPELRQEYERQLGTARSSMDPKVAQLKGGGFSEAHPMMSQGQQDYYAQQGMKAGSYGGPGPAQAQNYSNSGAMSVMRQFRPELFQGPMWAGSQQQAAPQQGPSPAPQQQQQQAPAQQPQQQQTAAPSQPSQPAAQTPWFTQPGWGKRWDKTIGQFNQAMSAQPQNFQYRPSYSGWGL